jgi:hypothetical protein
LVFTGGLAGKKGSEPPVSFYSSLAVKIKRDFESRAVSNDVDRNPD